MPKRTPKNKKHTKWKIIFVLLPESLRIALAPSAPARGGCLQSSVRIQSPSFRTPESITPSVRQASPFSCKRHTAHIKFSTLISIAQLFRFVKRKIIIRRKKEKIKCNHSHLEVITIITRNFSSFLLSSNIWFFKCKAVMTFYREFSFLLFSLNSILKVDFVCFW